MTLALLITAVGGAWAGVPTVSVAGNWLNSQWDPTTNQMAYKDGVYSITFSNMPAGQNYEFKFALNNSWAESYGYSSTTAVELNKTLEIATQSGVDTNIKFDLAEACDVTISFNLTEPRTFMISTSGLVIGEDDKAPIKVAYNTAKTTASFEMPTSDVDVNYELVRDMSVQMTAQVGDGTQEQPRYRVKKDGNKFIPADMEMAAVPALFTVNDLIEKTTLAPQNYLVNIYAVDAEGQPTGQPMTFATFTFEPGIYAVKAVAAQGSDYDGETALSNTFKLYQGYEVTIPAGEYATFYKDENLYTEDEDAELYTIASVTDTEAVLSSAIKTAPSLTPLLVYNKSEQDKTFLLIPTTNDADEVIPAKEFKGSITSGELPASSSTADYYALNGKAFVWVKYAIEIGANKCWLQISNQPAAARAMTRSIVGGGNTTGINAIGQFDDLQSDYYDLNGRKLQGKPNKKGIYIHNGRKVIVR